ncbi:MAG: uroporphyrinogen-III synthase, partial [Candidatus Saccharimonadales bacterium]
LGLDLSEFHAEVLTPTEIVPAPAQGALAIQIRDNDTELFNALQPLNHPDVAGELAVEREVLKLFGGGCRLPLGCYCRRDEGMFQVFTSKADDGREFPDRLFIEAASTEGLAQKVVSYFDADRVFPQGVFISRELSEQSYFRKALEKHGIEVEGRSLIRTVPVITKLDNFILKNADWVFFSSKNAVEYFFKLEPLLPKKVKFGVMGSGSEDMLRRQGYFADYTGSDIDTSAVAAGFAKLANGKTVVFPSAENAMRSIQQRLSADTRIIDLPVYETILEEGPDPSVAQILVFTSPSNVEAYFADNLIQPDQKVIAIGRSTGKKLDEIDVKYTLPYSPDETGLAEAVFGISQ